MASQFFLQLSPEFGGTRFGPFSGSVHIGTDPSQCQITIPQAGIQPIHASIIDAGQGPFTVQPVDRSCGVWLYQTQNKQLWPVQAPVAAQPGDQLIVGHEKGPRFTLVRSTAPSSGGPSRSSSAQNVAMGVGKEIQRQWLSRLMYRNRIFRDISNLAFRYRSGGLSNPRFIVAALGTLFSLIAAAFVACSGALIAAYQFVSG